MAKKTRHTPASPLSQKAMDDLAYVNRKYRAFNRLRKPREYRRAWFRVQLANARDYHRSLVLRRALDSIRSRPADTFAPIDRKVGGAWWAFRVEHGLTGSMRGEIEGNKFAGTMTSNLLDSSSVIFLQNSEGETMRVLIPSPATAKEMLVQSLIRWRLQAGYEPSYRTTESWDHGRNTHVSSAINSFAHNARHMELALPHPEVIDAIDAACQVPQEQRPAIRISGELIQKGVTFAHAIEVNGAYCSFIPTGFFGAIVGVVREFLPRANLLNLTPG